MMTSPVLFNPSNFALPPVPEPEPIPPGQDWWDYFQDHRDLYMAPQVYDWTCSVAATTWVLQATGLNPTAAREQVAYQLGYPNCVNSAYGLMNTACVEDVFATYGVDSWTSWPSWDQMVAFARQTTGLVNSTTWYHFVGLRGLTGDGRLWIANSAEGYRGIYSTISRAQWDAWAGSWKVVLLER
jgi:hypothetical protein